MATLFESCGVPDILDIEENIQVKNFRPYETLKL